MQSSKSSPKHKFKATARPAAIRFEAIGTRWNIRIVEPMQDKAWSSLQHVIRQRIDDFDKTYSRFRADSWVAEIARATGTYDMPADGYDLLHFYEQLYKATVGKVTPLIGQVMTDAGYDAQYSFKQRTLKRPPRWERTLAYTRRRLTVSQPVLLDFGAAGKGYLVDIIGKLIEQSGVHAYVINAGGDIRHRSASGKALAVGLENPLDVSEAIGIASINNQSLCASSGSRRQWGALHHIIDPTELRSPQEITASWVVASDTMTADGLATALFFTDPHELQKRFSFAYAILYKGRELLRSQDFPAEIFTEESQTAL